MKQEMPPSENKEVKDMSLAELYEFYEDVVNSENSATQLVISAEGLLIKARKAKRDTLAEIDRRIVQKKPIAQEDANDSTR